MKRRDFLRSSLAASAGIAASPVLFGGIPVHAGTHNFFGTSAWEENDNILVVVQLFGGNDGLNTFVPFTDSKYYQNRPTLGVPPNQMLQINNPTMGLHPEMEGFQQLFGEGKLSVVQSVGYEGANRSHFRSTDIWLTGSGASTVLNTGWAGRYLEGAYPNYPLELPPDPIAVQIGGTLSMMLQSSKGNMGITLRDPQRFFDLGGQLNYADETVPETDPYGKEYMFIRAIKEQSDAYRERVLSSFNTGQNIGSYPGSNLAQQLRLVGRLISGGLQSKMYMVYLGGFDTHVNQSNTHANLLRTVSDAVEAFVTDMNEQGHGQRVVGMTISEFGRRTKENGSLGTDHGTSSVQFLFGDPVNSGVLGKDPDFDVSDDSGDLIYNFDYRQIYSELLEHWFGVPEDDVTQLLGGRFVPLPVVRSTVGVDEPQHISDFNLAQNFPNPFSGSSGVTHIPFYVHAAAHVDIALYDVRGREIGSIASGMYGAGRHTVQFAPSGLPPGMYFYRMTTGGRHVTRQMHVKR